MTPAFALAGALLLAAILVTHSSRARVFERPGAPSFDSARSLPPVTVVRPIKGLDVGARENLEALLTQDYPGRMQVLLVLDDERDPSYALAREVAEAHRARGADVEVLLSGAPPPERTGKLNAMMAGLERATGELVAFNDSDTRPAPWLTRVLVERLLDTPGAGDTFAPVVATFEPSTRVESGDVAYALLLNVWYGPSALLAAGRSGELPFIMGQYMVFSRPALDAIGGLASAEGHFVDDMQLGRNVARAGLKNIQIQHAMPIVTGGQSLLAFLRTFRRWLLFSRGGLPVTFTRPHFVRGVLGALCWVLPLSALLVSGPVAALVPAAALGTFAWCEASMNLRCGGDRVPWRLMWVPAVLPLLGLAVVVSTRVARRTDWRGRTYDLDRAARLASPPQTGSD